MERPETANKVVTRKLNLRLYMRRRFFCMATSQSPGLPEILTTAYNSGMCRPALPVIISI